MRIDFHGHFLPPRFFERMEALDARHRAESFAYWGPLLERGAHRQFRDGEHAFLENWINEMEEGGVDLTIASVGAVQPYFEDRAAAVAAARGANELLQEAVAHGQGRIAAFGSLPLPHTAAALREIAFCLDQCRFPGVNLGCSAGGLPLDAPEFDAMWEALDARSAVVFLHPGTTPCMGVGSADHGLAPALIGPTEVGVALCRLVAARIPLRYPRVRVVAAVTGGTLPLLARHWDAILRASRPDLYEELGGAMGHLRGFWYDTSLQEDPRIFDIVRGSVGVDRLVLGSDTPRAPVAAAVEFITTSALLDSAEKKQILDANGVRVLPEAGQG
ncbi:amidohydrolase family protein [Streptomyces sp. NPDC017988]|uniref:amidohydrolase family protein n=1 Tax=Streptomyces sp. NPDC017988 TaxID=3365025 RepID=UPI003793654C